MDNPFDTPVTGQADWDSGLGANFQALERGYHVTERAGIAISTGQVLALDSNGFLLPFDVNSTLLPAAYSYTSALSGEQLTALAWGIVRSLNINSAIVSGIPYFGSATTPGALVTTPAGPVVGLGLDGWGILFHPDHLNAAGATDPTSAINSLLGKINATSVALDALTDDVTSLATSADGRLDALETDFAGLPTSFYHPSYVTRSLALVCTTVAVANFTMVASGLFGWNRRLRVNGTPTLAEIKLYQDAARTVLMYATFSGGISAANSFQDRAGFPFDCDSGTIYGTAQTFDSNATLTIIADWEV